MTPQASFMILAPIDPERETALRQLLAAMNHAVGRVKPNNTIIPFGQFAKLHFARLLIVDDKTINDIRAYHLPPVIFPLYLAFLGDVDGDRDALLEELARRAPNGLRSIFLCCDGFTSDTDLVAWMKQHSTPSAASYVNWRGRTVRCIREEARFCEALDDYIEGAAATLTGLPSRQIHPNLRQLLQAEASSGRLTLTPPYPHPHC